MFGERVYVNGCMIINKRMFNFNLLWFTIAIYNVCVTTSRFLDPLNDETGIVTNCAHP